MNWDSSTFLNLNRGYFLGVKVAVVFSITMRLTFALTSVEDKRREKGLLWSYRNKLEVKALARQD